MTMSMTFTLRFSCHFVFCHDWWSETYKTMSKEPYRTLSRRRLASQRVPVHRFCRLESGDQITFFYTNVILFYFFFQWGRPGSFLRREGEGHGVGQKYGVAGCGEDQNYLWEGGGRRRERVRLKP